MTVPVAFSPFKSFKQHQIIFNFMFKCIVFVYFSKHSMQVAAEVQFKDLNSTTKPIFVPPDLGKYNEVCVAWNKGGGKSSARGIAPSDKKA